MKENKISKKKKKRSQLTQSKSKRDMTGKQKKRLSALEELMVNDDEEKQPPVVHSSISYEETVESADGDTEAVQEKNEEDNNGILGKIKGFYDKADSMAASQALLLNKELEDRGVIDKITDESGLKVIGKDAAAAEQTKKEKDNQNDGD